MKKHYKILLASTVVVSMAACSGETKHEVEPAQIDTIAEDEAMGFGFGDMNQTSYQVPSPNELFSIIKTGKLAFKEGLVTTEALNYTSSKTQALNFGRITADIAYTASYEKFQESITNFDNLRKIGNDLGISYVFDEMMVNRVKTNMANSDSLEIISNDSYHSIIGQLEDNEKGSTLAIISVGGFVESIYLLSNLLDGSNNENLMQSLADQKLVLENVIAYLDMYNDEERIQEVLSELRPISDIYLNLKEEKKSKSITEKDHKNILGGDRVVMTTEEFNKLKDAATAYRNSFSNAQKG